MFKKLICNKVGCNGRAKIMGVYFVGNKKKSMGQDFQCDKCYHTWSKITHKDFD